MDVSACVIAHQTGAPVAVVQIRAEADHAAS